MTPVITPIEQALLEKVRSLPLEQQREVLNFAEFLALKAKETHEAVIQPTPPSIDGRQLSGMLYQTGRQTVSLEEMDRAIAECVTEQTLKPAQSPKLKQRWAEGLRAYREQYRSGELQKETLKDWKVDEQ